MNHLYSLPRLPEPNPTRPSQNESDVEPFVGIDGQLYVPVAVNTLAGWYAVHQHKVYAVGHHSTSKIYTPTGFECAGGKELNRKWRISIRVLLPDGSRGCTLGLWLARHSLEYLVPSPTKAPPPHPCPPDADSGEASSISSPSPTPSLLPYPDISGEDIQRKSPQKRNRSPSVLFMTASPSAPTATAMSIGYRGGVTLGEEKEELKVPISTNHYESPTKQRRTTDTDEVVVTEGTKAVPPPPTFPPNCAIRQEFTAADHISAFMQQHLALSSPMVPTILPSILAPPPTPVFHNMSGPHVTSGTPVNTASYAISPNTGTDLHESRGGHERRFNSGINNINCNQVLSSTILALPLCSGCVGMAPSPLRHSQPHDQEEVIVPHPYSHLDLPLLGPPLGLERSNTSTDLVHMFDGVDSMLDSPHHEAQNITEDDLRDYILSGRTASLALDEWEIKNLMMMKSDRNSGDGSPPLNPSAPGSSPGEAVSTGHTEAAKQHVACFRRRRSGEGAGICSSHLKEGEQFIDPGATPSPPPEMLVNKSSVAAFAAEDASPEIGGSGVALTHSPPHNQISPSCVKIRDRSDKNDGPVVKCDGSIDCGSLESCQEAAKPPAPPLAEFTATELKK